MLKKNRTQPARKTGGRFAIVASRYNARYVGSMLKAAVAELKRGGGEVEVVRVPGAFEIPVIVQALASGERRLDAIVCLGVVIRGETTHAQHITEAVTSALVQVQLQHRLPVIHEVLLLENEAQAKARCLDPERNRGVEAAQTALEMARLLRLHS